MHRWTAKEDEAARRAYIGARRVGIACDDLLKESPSVIQLVKISFLQGRLGNSTLLPGDQAKDKLIFVQLLCNSGFTLRWF